MKKILIALLATSMVLCMAACGGGDAASTPPASTAPASTAPASSAAPVSSAPAESAAPAAEAGAEQAYSLDFELINWSNADLTEIYVSPSSSDTWGENLLPAGYVLPNGNSVPITFDDTGAAGETWDMYTVDEDGDEYSYFEIPLTQIVSITLEVEVYDDGTYNNTYTVEYAA